MEISFEATENIKIIGILGRLDTSTYTQLENKVFGEIGPGTVVLIDCSGMDYISSSGLRVLLLALKKADAAGSKLALCALKPGIMQIFKISAFDRIFTIYPDREAAVRQLTG